ncbi:MAG: hypothetical protein ACREMQ_07175 [Longimicrobiales bacterium]
MDVDEIMALDRELTDEEFAFLEQQLLVMARALFQNVQELTSSIADKEPELSKRLLDSAGSMLLNVELAAAMDDEKAEQKPD